MALEISDDFLHAARMSEEEMAMEVAVILYRDGNLPLSRAAEFARLDAARFAHLLASRGIPVTGLLPEAERR